MVVGKLHQKLVCINNVSISWVEIHQKVHYKRIYLHISNTPHCVLYHHRCFCVYSVAVDKTHVTASNPGVVRMETHSIKIRVRNNLKRTGNTRAVSVLLFPFLCRLLLRLLRAIWSEFLLLFVVVFLLLLYIPTILLAVVIFILTIF